MKLNYRYLTLFILCLVPFGCTHFTHNQQEQTLANAKASFVSQNYPAAFKQLRPLARQGNAEAQYALGYLYFYGKGQPKNIEQAKFWIAKSADQRYLPAIRALSLMKNQTMQVENTPSKQTLPTITQKVIANQKLTNVRPTQSTLAKDTTFKTAAETTATSQTTTFSEHKTRVTTTPQTNPSTTATPAHSIVYTVQLIAAHDPSAVQAFIAAHQFDHPIHYYTTQVRQQTWYVATLGQFDTLYEAKRAISMLPTDLRNLKPWIRRASTLAAATAHLNNPSIRSQKHFSPGDVAAIAEANKHPAAEGEEGDIRVSNTPKKSRPSTTQAITQSQQPSKTASTAATTENEHQATQYHGWMRVV